MAALDAARLLVGVERGLAQAELDVVAHVEPGEAGVLLEHDADAVGNRRADRAAFEFDRRPRSAGVRPAISSSSVDLPQPDGPTTAKNSPLRMSKIDRAERMHAPARRRWRESAWSPRAA